MSTIHRHQTTTSPPEQFVAKTVQAIEARSDEATTQDGTSRAHQPEGQA